MIHNDKGSKPGPIDNRRRATSAGSHRNIDGATTGESIAVFPSLCPSISPGIPTSAPSTTAQPWPPILAQAFSPPESAPPPSNTEEELQPCGCKSSAVDRSGSDAEKADAASECCNCSSHDRSSLNNLEPQPSTISYPEGGREAWLVVFGGFCGMFACFGYMNTVGVYQAEVSRRLPDYADSDIGWIFSVYIFLSFGCGILIGPFFDKHGPRLLVLSGSIVLVLSMMLMSLSTEYWHYMMSFGLLGGTGTALVFTPAVSAIGHYFLVKRGNATGIATTGGSIGGIVFPLTLQSLFSSVGWGWALRVQGFIALALLIVANLTIKSRLPPTQGGTVMPDFRIFRNVPFALVTAGTFFMEWGLFTPITYLPAFAVSTGAVSESFSYQIVAIFNAASVFGRWVPGYLSDVFGRFNLMIIALFLCLGSTAALWVPVAVFGDDSIAASVSNATTVGMIVAYAIIMGFASGSNISLTPVCVGNLCHTSQYGRYFATCYSIVSLGTLTGVPIAGAIIPANGGAYWGMAIFCALSYLCSLTAYIMTRVKVAGPKLTTCY